MFSASSFVTLNHKLCPSYLSTRFLGIEYTSLSTTPALVITLSSLISCTSPRSASLMPLASFFITSFQSILLLLMTNIKYHNLNRYTTMFIKYEAKVGIVDGERSEKVSQEEV